MSRQVYLCEEHGEFERIIPIKDEVPKTAKCIWYDYPRYCTLRGKWVPSAPNFIGGPTTGAGKE